MLENSNLSPDRITCCRTSLLPLFFHQATFCVHPKTGKACVPIDPDSVCELVLTFPVPSLPTPLISFSLQAPFCVHPKTGKVCVPIDPDRAFEFDPETVPTVHQLLEQLDEHQREAQGDTAAAVSLWADRGRRGRRRRREGEVTLL